MTATSTALSALRAELDGLILARNRYVRLGQLYLLAGGSLETLCKELGMSRAGWYRLAQTYGDPEAYRRPSRARPHAAPPTSEASPTAESP